MRLGFGAGRPRGSRLAASEMPRVPNPLRPTGAGDGSVCDHRESAERDCPAGKVAGESEKPRMGVSRASGYNLVP